MMIQKRLPSQLSLVVVLIIAILAGAGASNLAASDSPEDAFDKVRAALAKKDFKGLIANVAPSQRVMMAFTLDMGVDMAVSFWEGDDAEAAQKTYAELRARYDLSDDEDTGPELEITSDTAQEEIDAHIARRAEALYEDVDVSAYIPELLDFFMATPMMEGEQLFPDTDLTNVKIDGDSATGMAGETAIEFIREDGKWYLAAPM